MKIQLSDGSVAYFEIRYEYLDWNRRTIKELLDYKKQFEDTYNALETLGILSEGNKPLVDRLREWYKSEIQTIKGDIKILCKETTKTEVELQWNGRVIVAGAKISREDAQKRLYDRKIGRMAACRNLIRALGVQYNEKGQWTREKIMPTKLRGELALKLGLTKQ
jgi:hypothetical protein